MSGIIIQKLPATKDAITHLAATIATGVPDEVLIERLAQVEAYSLYLESLRKELEPRAIEMIEVGKSVQVEGVTIQVQHGRESWDFSNNLAWVNLQSRLDMAKDQVKQVQEEISALEGYLKKQYHSQLADTSTGEVLERPKYNGCGKPIVRITIPKK